MKRIQTVLGSIKPEALGFTSMHEHVMIDIAGAVRRSRAHANTPGTPDDMWKDAADNSRPDAPGTGRQDVPAASLRDAADAPISLSNVGLIQQNRINNWEDLLIDDETLMCGEVEDFRRSGGSALLEMSVPGIRTKVSSIKNISDKTGVHIIVSTGLYTSGSWPERFHGMTEQAMMRYMLDEYEHGIEGTGIRPGHLKIGVDRLNADEETALRAAAKVSNETGLSMTVHCSATSIGASGKRIAAIVKQEAADPSRLVIAHAAGGLFARDLRQAAAHPETIGLKLDDTLALMDMGVNVSLECIGPMGSSDPYELHVADWVVVVAIVALLKRGYSSQILLGTDTCRKTMTRRFGGEGYCRLTQYVIPRLRDLGVSDHDIRDLTERNPARILAF